MISQKNILICIIIFLTILSYFIGFYLNENSAGAGSFTGDINHVWKNLQIYLNNDVFISLSSSEYYSNRPPLLYIFHKYLNPLTDNINTFRISVFFFSMSAPLVFYFCLKKKYPNSDKLHLILLSSLIILSPYFRTSSFWGLEENFGIISVLVAFIFYFKYLKLRSTYNLFLLAFFSSLCVYFDQKSLVIPMIFFLDIIFFNNIPIKKKFILILFFVLFSLPYLYLIFKWKGIFPPSHKDFHDFKILLFDNIIYTISILGIYFIPFLLLRKNNITIFTELFYKKLFLFSLVTLILFIFYVEIFFLRPDFNFHSSFDGGGAIRKLSFILFQNVIVQKILLSLSVIISWIIICSFIDKRNIYIILFYIILSPFIYPLYQETFDPIILILILLFFLKVSKFNFKNLTLIYFYFTIFLVSSIIYYLK